MLSKKSSEKHLDKQIEKEQKRYMVLMKKIKEVEIILQSLTDKKYHRT